MSFRPRHFMIEELVGPEVIERLGDERAWELLDVRALITLDALRMEFGPVTVNDWHRGGSFKESGFRNGSTTTGAAFSQHRFGRAFDCKFKDVTPSFAREMIEREPLKFPHITTIEDTAATPTWLHFDVRANATPGIRIVKP